MDASNLFAPTLQYRVHAVTASLEGACYHHVSLIIGRDDAAPLEAGGGMKLHYAINLKQLTILQINQ
jgi:hypothetical protein